MSRLISYCCQYTYGMHNIKSKTIISAIADTKFILIDSGFAHAGAVFTLNKIEQEYNEWFLKDVRKYCLKCKHGLKLVLGRCRVHLKYEKILP